MCPSFIDGHVHLESSMMLPKEFAKAVLPTGTSGVFTDPHEIANVMGIDGIKFMKEHYQNIGLDVYFMLPSCGAGATTAPLHNVKGINSMVNKYYSPPARR